MPLVISSTLQPRFIPVRDVNISNIESVKSSTFPLRGERFLCYFRYLFSKQEKGEYFLTSYVDNLSGSEGRGGVELTSDGTFLLLLESTLRRIEFFGCFSLLRQDEYNCFF